MIVSCVLEKPLGELAEGCVLQVEEEIANSLVSGGIARLATEDDMGGDDVDAEEIQEEMPVEEAVERVARSVEAKIAKATKKVTEKLAVGRSRISVSEPEIDRTGGFDSFGSYLQCAIAKQNGDLGAIRKMGRFEDQIRRKGTMSISGGSGLQGGSLIPQQWSENLWKISFDGVPDLLGMMTKYEMRNQVMNIPAWVQPSPSTGVVANVIGEASTITDTVGVTATVQLSLVKNAVLVNATHELLTFNSYNFPTILNQIVPQRIRYRVNQDIVNGTNGGVGLKNNATAVVVQRAVANRISYRDVLNMYAAVFDDFVDGAIWLINQSTAPELYSLAFPNTTTSTPFPAFTPGSFGSEQLLGPKPVGSLLGLPVFKLENVPSLGTQGDLILFNPKSLAAGYTQMFTDSTPSLYFTLAEESFRFLWYTDTVNPLTSVYTRQNGSTASNIVVLGDPAA